MDFFKACEKGQVSYTENGAEVYSTSGRKLVDLNFKVPSLRKQIDKVLFEESLNEDLKYTLKWLLFLRDVRGGLGERKAFRDLILALEQYDQKIAHAFIVKVPIEEFGRWDDIIYLAFNMKYKSSRDYLFSKVYLQFTQDSIACKEGKPISLLAKWMPSINTSSADSRSKAKVLADEVALSPKMYRKQLAKLRSHIDVVECKMTSNEWEDIKYCNVPSKASLLYSQAFRKHDEERYNSYIEDLKSGKTKVNVETLYLHEILLRVRRGVNDDFDTENGTDFDFYEELWKKTSELARKDMNTGDTLVVRDGSGSMYSACGYKSSVKPIDVCDALTLFFAESNTGAFKNKFITFSNYPKVVDITRKRTLKSKLKHLENYDDIGSTNIETVFDMILGAVSGGAEAPTRVLILSDMQFNWAVSDSKNRRLFEIIADKYNAAGVKIPKVVFWNLDMASRDTVPMQENENGLILLSGFSQRIMKQVISDKLDPWLALKEQLDSSRYSIIDEIVG